MAWKNIQETREVKVEEAKKEPLVSKEQNNADESIYNPEKIKVITFYGHKGCGKTTALLSVLDKKNKVLLISFDGMSRIIAKNFFPELTNIEVYDAIKFPRIVIDEKNDGTYVPYESIQNAYKNCQLLLERLKAVKKGDYDIIIFDGLNIAEKLAEGYMRYQKNLKFDEAFADFNNWKIRNAYISSLFWTGITKANNAVFYTLYPVEDVRKKKDGQVIDSESIPKYSEEVMYMTSIVIRIDRRDVPSQNGSQKRYFATIESSKIKSVPSGKVIDITNKKLSDEVSLL